MIKRLFFSYFNVYDKRSCDHYLIIQLFNRVIERLFLSYFSVSDRRSCDYYLIIQLCSYLIIAIK